MAPCPPLPLVVVLLLALLAPPTLPQHHESFSVNQEDRDRVRVSQAAADVAAITEQLWKFIRDDRSKMLRQWLRRRPEFVHLRSREDGRTPLHWAYEFDRPHMVRLLQDYGASEDVVDNSGLSPHALAPADFRPASDDGGEYGGDGRGDRSLPLSSISHRGNDDSDDYYHHREDGNDGDHGDGDGDDDDDDDDGDREHGTVQEAGGSDGKAHTSLGALLQLYVFSAARYGQRPHKVLDEVYGSVLESGQRRQRGRQNHAADDDDHDHGDHDDHDDDNEAASKNAMRLLGKGEEVAAAVPPSVFGSVNIGEDIMAAAGSRGGDDEDGHDDSDPGSEAALAGDDDDTPDPPGPPRLTALSAS